MAGSTWRPPSHHHLTQLGLSSQSCPCGWVGPHCLMSLCTRRPPTGFRARTGPMGHEEQAPRRPPQGWGWEKTPVSTGPRWACTWPGTGAPTSVPEGRARARVSSRGRAHRRPRGVTVVDTPSFLDKQCPAQALAPALAPLVPGEETHALRVGAGGGKELPGAPQLQVGEVLPVPRGGQQALQGLQRRPAGEQRGSPSQPCPRRGCRAALDGKGHSGSCLGSGPQWPGGLPGGELCWGRGQREDTRARACALWSVAGAGAWRVPPPGGRV